jgi:hypothetical protein
MNPYGPRPCQQGAQKPSRTFPARIKHKSCTNLQQSQQDQVHSYNNGKAYIHPPNPWVTGFLYKQSP